MGKLIDALIVLGALLACYGLPTWYATRCWRHPGGVVDRFLRAFMIGVCSQAVIGLLWSKFVHSLPQLEPLIYLCLWVVISLIVALRRTRMPAMNATPKRIAFAWLGLIVVGVGWRWVPSLQVSALGQSDAYSHLTFIWDVIGSGKIRNQIYPSGYHWVMALPCLTAKTDPYLVARYGGAFSALLLMLAVGSIAAVGSRVRAGVMAAVLISFFPGFLLLAKTNVGAFPNQIGLVLIVVILRSWLAVLENHEGSRPSECMALALYLAGLAATVPLMLVPVAICIAAERVTALWIDRRDWWRKIAILLGVAIPVVCLLLVQFLLVRAGWRVASVDHVIAPRAAQQATHHAPEAAGLRKAVLESPYAGLLFDFLMLKRVGLQAWPLNLIAMVMGAAFLGTIMVGLRSRSSPLTLLGLWGVLCTVQTATGVFQFTNYQRAGWMLLICCGWFGGTVYDAACRMLPRRVWVTLTAVGLAVCLALAFRRTPRHVNIMSSAEDDVVDVLRQVVFYGPQDPSGSRWIRVHHPARAAFLDLLNPAFRLRVVMREVSVFRGHMGEILPAIIGPFRRADVYVVGCERHPAGMIRGDSQSMVLVDRFAPLSPDGFQVAATMGLGVANRYPDGRRGMYRRNDQMLDVLNSLDEKSWSIATHLYSPRLSLLFVEPVSP
ncbi:MAG: hypothetical protein O2973_12800 [Gemmatimonadetes bacterium]|nr:hypothetical protein [Gemmatimonadota bacterium]